MYFQFLGEKIGLKLRPERYIWIAPNNSMKLILLCVWAEPAVLGSAKTALEYKYEI